ncbi:MAG: leucine-rich repeat domain-containing protein [Planctomycetaceae bacterium]
MTANEDDRALIRHPSSTPIRTGVSRSGVLQRMTASTLQLMRQFPPPAAVPQRFTLGDIAFAEPDYRQLLIWAEALGLRPEELVLRLQQQPPYELAEQTISFKVVNGSIRDLVWDLSAFPVADFAWVDGLKIEKLAFCGRGVRTTKLVPRLPQLTTLYCCGIQLTELALSSVPELTNLYCHDNLLTELDLSSVPLLFGLWCKNNRLTELDLSRVPQLTALGCWSNRLMRLGLTSVPKLTNLYCGDNKLMELDLSNVPQLGILYCWNNQLTQLDLSNVPQLTMLICNLNQLTALDLSNVPLLTTLRCDQRLVRRLNTSFRPFLKVNQRQ